MQRNFDALNKAILHDDIVLLKQSVESGIDINSQDETGCTALYSAIVYGRADIIQYLLEEGADVNIPDNEGRTALELSILPTANKIFTPHMQELAEYKNTYKFSDDEFRAWKRLDVQAFYKFFISTNFLSSKDLYLIIAAYLLPMSDKENKDYYQEAVSLHKKMTGGIQIDKLASNRGCFARLFKPQPQRFAFALPELQESKTGCGFIKLLSKRMGWV